MSNSTSFFFFCKGKLLPGDEIHKVNGEDVCNAQQNYVIDQVM